MKKKRTEKRRPTDEEMSRADDAKLKRYITRSAIEWAEGEPEVRRQMVAQTFGYNLPDQAEKSERKLLAVIDELAIRRIEEDHELAKRITDARIRQVTEEMGLKVEGEERRKKPLTFQDLIRQVREYKELKEEFGVKEPGLIESLLQPEVIISFLKMLHAVTGGAEQKPAVEREFIWVQENGEEKRLTEEEYLKLVSKVNNKYVDKAAADTGKEESATPGEIKQPLSEPDNSSAPEGEEESSGADGSGD